MEVIRTLLGDKATKIHSAPLLLLNRPKKTNNLKVGQEV